jgi:hypothetical protein
MHRGARAETHPMPENEHLHEDIPRFEPWLGVMLGAVVPALGTVYAPSRFLIPLIIATVTLFVASLVMLRRQTSEAARARS